MSEDVKDKSLYDTYKKTSIPFKETNLYQTVLWKLRPIQTQFNYVAFIQRFVRIFKQNHRVS